MTFLSDLYGQERMLTVAEAAELMAVSEKTIRRYIDSGEILAYYFGRNVRIKESDLTQPMTIASGQNNMKENQ